MNKSWALILLEKQLKGGVKELEKNVFGEAMNSNHSSDSFLDGFGRGDSTPGEAGYATKEMSRGEIAEESDAGNDRMRTGVSEGDEERDHVEIVRRRVRRHVLPLDPGGLALEAHPRRRVAIPLTAVILRTKSPSSCLEYIGYKEHCGKK